MATPSLENLPDFSKIPNMREELTIVIDNIDSLINKANLCVYLSALYKTMVANMPEGETKERAKRDNQYFADLSWKNKTQYEMQDEMLPEQFNRDIPLGPSKK